MAITMVTLFLTSCEKDAIEKPLITDYEKAAEILDQYVVEKDGFFTVLNHNIDELGIEQKVYNQLIESLDALNSQIQMGEIQPSMLNKAYDIETNEEVSIIERGCNENKVVKTWYGKKFYVSSRVASLTLALSVSLQATPYPSTNKSKNHH